MEPAVESWPSDHTASAQTSQQLHTPTGYCSTGYKRMKIFNRRKDKDSARVAFLANVRAGIVKKQEQAPSDVIDYSDPFAVSNLMNKIESGKYGSVTKEIEDICAQKMQLLNSYYVKYPTLACMSLDVEKGWSKDGPNMETQIVAYRAQQDVIDLEDDGAASHVEAKASSVVIIDSDDEDGGHQRPSCVFQESLLKNSASVVLRNPGSGHLVKDLTVRSLLESRALIKQEEIAAGGIEIKKDTGEYVGVQDDTKTDEGNHQNDTEDDGLGDIWKEMTVVLECSKETFRDPSSDGLEEEEYEDCEHSFVLKDDLGYVCRICGVIQKRIENIFDFQYLKTSRSTRTYKSETRDIGDKESSGFLSDRLKLSEDEFAVTDICPHPRHRKQMKPHQVEGFNFLVSNLVSDNPGGCILAHAPGSGKTFMIISFMQSFLGKYPYARPLVVLPKGILATWKKEFEIWQVEDMPLLDFYSVKAENRPQQLEVLKQWVDTKSILFLGYKQFSTVICDNGASKAATACQEILLKAPTILILDEGHTPRNENTDVLHSLAKIQTPRKVVLSGTLYQNHVKEVFNILNLVRPKFLRLDASRSVVKRIMSKVQMSGIRKQLKANADMAFFDLVEHTLQKDHDFRRKVTVIQDLREMTSKVLHYYKGDFLEELPGLEDFTLLLKLSAKQKAEVEKLKKLGTKFKRNSVGSAVYMHPSLKQFSEGMPSSGDKLSCVNDEKMDEMLEKLNVRDGVKAKFYLNILGLCESTGEKMLVFSQYLLPLKFLERLTMNVKGWSPGKELFTISGDSSAEVREWSMDRFNNSSDAKVFFGSIKACGEGISLVGASRILVLDVHLNPSVTRQAIGRAFRPGQKKKVFTYRLVAANSPEEEDHSTCFRKELISKMWFEWNEYCGYQEFEVKTVDVKDSGDLFLESPSLQEDVTVLYRRLVS